MANWYGTARSNRFKVVDVDAFTEELSDASIDINIDGDTVTLFGDDDDTGGWPTTAYDEESGDDYEIDLPSIIQRHIQEDSCAILMEVGAEKLRYVTGWSCAISKKEVVYVNLDEIYRHAEEMMDAPVDTATY